MVEHIKWTEIESFHNIRKFTAAYPELLGSNPVVTYRGKVKLHGTNAAVQVSKDGIVTAQSRTAILTPTSDNAGFAKWVEEHKQAWSRLSKMLENDQDTLVVFGEWCGPGIQKGVAVNQIPRKIFAIFAVQILPGDTLIVEPEEIATLTGFVQGVFGIHILPWHYSEVSVEWLTSAETLQKTVDAINEDVIGVEMCDPWVKLVFDVEGTGEGLVYYPISHPGRKAFGDYCFKAKGEAHKVVKSKQAAQVNPEVAANASAFVTLVLTEARLEQGARALNGNGDLVFEMKDVGKFIGWINQDVLKEAADELEASNLEWKQVQKQVGDSARAWYMNKCKTL